jgi:hypothetical protein
MNLTHEYKTVRAIFEKPLDEHEGFYQKFGPEDDEDEESESQQFQTYFRVGPIEYYVELDKIEDICYVNFGYFNMKGKTEELTQYFSRLYGKEVNDIELARLKDSFERRPNGILKLGNAGKVFGNVLAILQDFKSKHDFSCLKFSSAHESRTDLYRHMIERFLPDWEVTENQTGGMIWFTACEPGVVDWPY